MIVNGGLSSDQKIVEFEMLRGVRKMCNTEQTLDFILAARMWGPIGSSSEKQRSSEKLTVEL